MKTLIPLIAFGVCLSACTPDAAPRPGSAPAAVRTQPTAPSTVVEWPLPANLPGSALPDLERAPDGRLLLSWTNSQRGRRHILQFAAWDPALARWQSAPMTVAIGNSMFVNWADTAHITATADGTLWAHWLQNRADAPGAYDIMLTSSRNGGARWSPPLMPHDDGTATEHGFVSLWAQGPGSLGIAWLDGRNTGVEASVSDAAAKGSADVPAGNADQTAGGPQAGQGAGAVGPVEGHADGHAHGGGAMTLRAATFDAAMRRSGEQEIDARVCDCCRTDVAVTARGPLLVYRGRSDEEVRDILATRLEGGRWRVPAPVHADRWTMPACPVNGPSVAADGEAVVVGWYTAPGDIPQVRLAHSADAGDRFSAPVQLDRGEAVQGRVDVAIGSGEAWALWLREDTTGQSLWLSRRSPDLVREYERIEVARLQGRGRGTGFPQLALRDGIAYVVWTDVVDGTAQLRGARVMPR